MTVTIGPGSHHQQHAPHPWFDVVDDELIIAGQRLSNVAAAVGQTPFYVYDRTVIDRKIAQLRHALPKSVQIKYAIKANPYQPLVNYMARAVDGFDVASGKELVVALNSGMDAQHISFAGPGKSEPDIAAAVAANVLINVESQRELRVLSEISQATGRKPRIAVRVNPAFELKSSGMKMGGGPKPFGIDAELVPDLLREIRTLPVDFCGLHIFSGSQNLQAAAIIEAQQLALALAIELSAYAPSPMKQLNLGGGFGIPYFPGERMLDLEPIGTQLTKLASEAAAKLPGTQLVMELGRYLVGECGIYVCRVIERKISRGSVFLIVDGGMHHHLGASGNLGQAVRKNFPVVVGNRIRGGAREVVSVTGPLCTPLDVLADRMEMAQASPGDFIAVLQSGAYGLTASPTGFLSHPLPQELLI